MADKQVEISLGTLGGLLLTNSAKGSGQVQTKGFKTPPDPATIVNFIPKTRADKPDGEWNRTMVTIEGNILTVAMNGRVVIEGIELPENSERAPLILKPAQGQIEFANLWIKEL